jgi:hypothetical protein
VVSVVIVPEAGGERPQPSHGLLQQVKQFLDARCPVGVELVVLGPLYVAYRVEAGVAVADGRAPATVTALCVQALRRFLHPLAGGTDGAGWNFGVPPHLSDFYALLAGVDGVDHVRSLRLRTDTALPDLLQSGLYLACSGDHQVRAVD